MLLRKFKKIVVNRAKMRLSVQRQRKWIKTCDAEDTEQKRAPTANMDRSVHPTLNVIEEQSKWQKVWNEFHPMDCCADELSNQNVHCEVLEILGSVFSSIEQLLSWVPSESCVFMTELLTVDGLKKTLKNEKGTLMVMINGFVKNYCACQEYGVHVFFTNFGFAHWKIDIYKRSGLKRKSFFSTQD